ncbi:MAG: carboxypeptidase regulatory-like domain-containing protein [Planctomycetota bacterium]
MQRSTAIFLLLALMLAVVVAIASWPDRIRPPERLPEWPASPAGTGSGTDPTGQAPPLPATAPRVRVAVKLLERYVPPPPKRVQAVRLGDGLELPTELLAGVGAGFDPGPPRPGLALVGIAYDGGSLLRQVPVAMELARPTVGARILCRGHVRDAAQKPVSGARVWLGEQDGEGRNLEVSTDADGVFELAVPAGHGVPFVVRAEGLATAWRAVSVAPPIPEFEITLQPAGRLEVQLAGTADGLDDARLFVLPTSSVSTEVALYPFFAQVLTRGFPIDAKGHAFVTDLPQSGELSIVVQHARAPGMAPHSVTLAGKSTRAVLPIEFATSVWRGLVVDEAGSPVVGASLWSRLPGQDLAPGSSLRLLPPHLEGRGRSMATTDADGAFAIGGLSAPDAVLSLRKLGCAGRDVVWAHADPKAPFVLPRWNGDEVAFRLLPPVSGVAWRAESDLAGGIEAALAADRAWLVAFPHAGRFEVVVTTFVGDRQWQRTFEHVDATGTVELQAPSPK